MKKNKITELIKNVVRTDNSDAEIILFGSRARKDAKKDSDWDILVLLNRNEVTLKDEQKIRHKLFDVELETGESISTFVYALNDWHTRLSVTPLYHNVKKEGIYL